MTQIFLFINKFFFRFLAGYAIMIWLVCCDYAGSRRKITAQTLWLLFIWRFQYGK